MLAPSVLLTVLLAAPSQAADAPVEGGHVEAAADPQLAQDELAQAKNEGIFDNVMERRYAFSMNDNLHPSLAGNLWPFFIGGFCCAGQVWFPLLVLGNAPKGYFEEALVTWLFYAVPLSLFYVVPYVGWGLGVLLFPIQLAVNFYMIPVNAINAWDRTAKRGGVPQRRRGELAPPAPHLSALLVESPMAY
jgi:hypothetical protein